MILPLFDWMEQRDILCRRTINGEPAHRFWWWHIGLAFKGQHWRYKGRPRTRALMIGEGVIYPLVWAGWFAFCLLVAVLSVPLRGLLGLPGAVFAILEGVAGPGYFPVLTRRWVLGWWTKYDPPKPSPGPARPARRRVVEPVPAPSERTLGVGACPNCRNEVDPSWGHCPYCEHRA